MLCKDLETAPPVLTASIPEDTPGPSDQEEEEDDDEESQPRPRRKRRREDEAGHEAPERMERLFSAPEDNPYIIYVVV